MELYTIADHMAEFYNLLQDDLSRNIFWARMQFDLEPSMSRAVQLLRFTEGYTDDEFAALNHWKEIFHDLRDAQKKIFLYGAGSFGRLTADLILKDGEDFFAFCDRQGSDTGGNLNILGKPVYSPDYLFKHMQQSYVVIATIDYYKDIEYFLLQNGFPPEQILQFHFEWYFNSNNKASNKQYFAFPELYRKGTTFVDAGCFDGENSIQFAKWCEGNYESILAFEPDDENYRICSSRMKNAGLHNVNLIKAGLSSRMGKSDFITGLDDAGYIIDEKAQSKSLIDSIHSDGELESIQTTTLDGLSKHIKAGFIKMDIEGSELSALQGAHNTIKRDKPFMAVSIYHRCGDVLAIMDYLHQIIPEYRFWIRHYGPLSVDTVLYASV